MRPSLRPLLLLVLLVMGCAGEACFYSFRSLAFVPLAQDPVRKQLVGAWSTSDGRKLVLQADGKFRTRSLSGCWDVDGDRLIFLLPCANYGAHKDSAMLTLAESTHRCGFLLRQRLVLRDCLDAGAYRRE